MRYLLTDIKTIFCFKRMVILYKMLLTCSKIDQICYIFKSFVAKMSSKLIFSNEHIRGCIVYMCVKHLPYSHFKIKK